SPPPDCGRSSATPPPPPIPFSYRTAEPTYSVYGWSVSMRRAAMEFSELVAVRPAGFQLAGSGSADIVTAPWYRAGKTYQVTLTNGSGGVATLQARADRTGRLIFSVTLGPAN